MNFSLIGRVITLAALLFVSVGCSGPDSDGVPEGKTMDEMQNQSMPPDAAHGGGGAQHGGGGAEAASGSN